MKQILLIIFTLFILCQGQLPAQSKSDEKKEAEILEEGQNLYRLDLASWNGTDIFLEQFKDKQTQAGGYFSYANGDETTCVFFSNADKPQIIASFTFDASFESQNAKVDAAQRDMTALEYDLYVIRKAALSQINKDTLFKTYKNTSLNLIPLISKNSKKVYVLTGPQKSGIVILGNDYLMTFDKKNQLTSAKALHKNIIPVDYAKDSSQVITMHTHLPETGDLITATDVCTLLLYEKFAKWKQHYVLSQNNVSIWDCESNQLTVLTREAWERIYNHQKQKNQQKQKE